MSLFWPGDERAGDLVTPAAFVAAMVTVESAWVDASLQTPTDLVERASAEAESGGNALIPLVEALREANPDRAEAIHAGLTSQDVVDTALVLLLRDAVAAVRGRDAEVADQHGDGAVWLAVAHGDIIKAVLADALGMHLDTFQRIVVDPASLSVVRYTAAGSFVLAMNTHSGSLRHLATQAGTRAEEPEEKLGGGAGPST